MKHLVILVAFATLLAKINAEKFSCEGRASGYYADVDTGCQIYHMCDGLGRQFSYSCPNTTLFQQRMLICDHWYMVNCSKSEIDYKANLLIGQRDKPFVEDSSEHPYHRTPRPDLLQQPYAPRYDDDEYRQGRAQSDSSSLNLVGVATDDDAEDELGNRKNFTTDRPQYFLPSHWSTQYGKYVTTPLPPSTNKFNGKAPVVPEKKFSNPDFKNRDVPPRKQQLQNFNNQKYFKAPSKGVRPIISVLPTPSNDFINPRVDNIPDSVNQESVSPSTLALAPFVPNQPKIIPQNFPHNVPQNIPRKGPQNIPQILPKRQPVTRQPQLTERPQISPSQILLSQQPILVTNPPSLISQKLPTSNIDNSKTIQKPSIYYQPPKISLNINVESSTMDPESSYKLIPSKDLLPPPLLPQLPLQSTSNTPPSPLRVRPSNPEPKKTTEDRPTRVSPPQSDNSEKRWKELRQMFFIPEYDFPLESGSRPSYESGLSSFQVNSAPPVPEAFRRPPDSSPAVPRGINPECPKCDPAFLAPGTCKPCVMIR